MTSRRDGPFRARLLCGTLAVVVVWLAVGMAADPAGAETPAAAASRLAKKVSDHRHPAAAGLAAAETLRWGGVGILHKRSVSEPFGPSSGLRALGAQAVNFAHQAGPEAKGVQVDLARAERVLHDLGAPVGVGGASLAQVMRNWVSSARQRPDDIHSFAPLFVAEMVRRRHRGVDLGAGGWKAARVRLSGLELELFTAALTRGIPSATGAARAAVDAHPGAALTPCSTAIDALDAVTLGPLGPNVGDEVKKYAGEEIRKAFESAYGREITEKQFSQLMLGLDVLAQIWSTNALYQSLSVRVFPQEDDSFHRPRHGDKAIRHFSVIVGIDENLWRAYKRELADTPPALRDVWQVIRDCLRAGGIPKLEDPDELASQVKDFVVRWHPLDAPNWLAEINLRKSHFDFIGSFRHKLRALNDHEAGAVMAVDVFPVDGATRSTKPAARSAAT